MPTQLSPSTTKLSFSALEMEPSAVGITTYISLIVLPLEKTSNIQEHVDPDLVTSMRDGLAGSLGGVPKRMDHENDAIPKIAPKWLKYDRQVSQSTLSTFSQFIWSNNFISMITNLTLCFRF